MIDDSSARGNTDTSTNELATLIMVDDTMVTVYLQTCEYSVSGGGWNVLSERPLQFSEAVQREVSQAMPSLGQTGLENSESLEESDETGEGEDEDGNPSSSQNNRDERENQSSQNNRTERETQSSQNNRTERESQSSQNNRTERETQRETSAPQVSPPPSTEAAQPGPAVPRPAEPGSETTAPAQTWPGPGDTIPTIEANPEQNTQIGNTPSSQEIQYIGPGGPLG